MHHQLLWWRRRIQMTSGYVSTIKSWMMWQSMIQCPCQRLMIFSLKSDNRTCFQQSTCHEATMRLEWQIGQKTSVVRYPRYLDTYRRYHTYVTIPVSPRSRYTAVYRGSKNTVRRRKYREYRRYYTAAPLGDEQPASLRWQNERNKVTQSKALR